MASLESGFGVAVCSGFGVFRPAWSEGLVFRFVVVLGYLDQLGVLSYLDQLGELGFGVSFLGNLDQLGE